MRNQQLQLWASVQERAGGGLHGVPPAMRFSVAGRPSPTHARRLDTRRNATKPDADLFCGCARSRVRRTSLSVMLSAKVQRARQRTSQSLEKCLYIDTFTPRPAKVL